MNIIIPGDVNRLVKIKRFECAACGCVFEATNKEYKDYSSQRDGILFYHECPCCKRAAYNYEP